MSEFAFPPPPTPSLPIVGSDLRFPVRRIFCVGRNYAAHRREMGGDDRDPPFFFTKPADAAIPPDSGPIPYPPQTADLHHEIELVVALGAGGANVSPDRALDLVYGYAVGVDLTRRDLQNAAKGKGQPWDASKAFDASAPLSAVRRWKAAPPQGRIRLAVNGQTRQDSTVAHMIWDVAEIISEASRLWLLTAGDLIFTGTPEGVGPLVRGDRVEGSVEDVGELRFQVG